MTELEQAIAKIICTHPDYNGNCVKCNKLEPHVSECFMKGMIQTISALIAAREQPLIEALREAKLQIEYLHSKFKETGSRNAVIAKIDLALAKEEGK